MIKLGNRVKDIVTGFKGVVVARLEYINGCVQFGVKPERTKKENGGQPDLEYIDWKYLKVIGKGLAVTPADTGADQPPKNRRG